MTFYKILKWFICITVVLSLFANIFISLNEGNFTGIFSFRNLFLLLFLSCFFYYTKWSLLLLLLINISFWYFYFTTNANVSYGSHPVINYTLNLQNLFSNSDGVKTLGKIILFVPLLINILISLVEMPLRIFKLKKRN